MRTPVTLRPMRSEEAAGVGAMHHRAWIDTYGAVLPQGYFATWTVGDAIQRWQSVLRQRRPRAFYARNGLTPGGATYTDDRFPELPEIRMIR